MSEHGNFQEPVLMEAQEASNTVGAGFETSMAGAWSTPGRCLGFRVQGFQGSGF